MGFEMPFVAADVSAFWAAGATDVLAAVKADCSGFVQQSLAMTIDEL